MYIKELLGKTEWENEEEMVEMAKAVHNLKVKEDELCSAKQDLKMKTSMIDQLCKQLLQQVQSRRKEMKSTKARTEKANTQWEFL